MQKNISVPRVTTLIKQLPLHYALRDILAEGSPSKVVIKDGNSEDLKRVTSPALYSNQTVYKENFFIDGYPDAECELKIWKHDKVLKNLDSRLREFGILVKGERAIHQCSLFGSDNDENAKYYSGKLVCKYIDHLMNEFDENEGEPLENNPAFIVDPLRTNGLNQKHPFTQALTKKVEGILRDLLEKDKKEKEQKSGDVSTKETRRRLNKLAREFSKIWSNEFDSEEPTDADERAVENTNEKGIYILPPSFKIEVGEVRSLTVYMKEENYEERRRVRVHSSQEKILYLVETFSNKKPLPHPKKEGILYGKIKVEGRKLGESTITIRPHKDKNISAVSTGKVVEKREEGEDHDFSEGVDFEFERKNYEILEGTKKKLKVFLKKSNTQYQEKVVASSDKPTYVETLGGHKFQLLSTPHNYVFAEVHVEGRSVTELNRPATITAKLNGKTAKTVVRVVDKKTTMGERFQFELTRDSLGPFRARWADAEGKPNLLKISAVHPSISHYFGDPNKDFPGQKEPAGIAIIAELISEQFCIKILQEEMKRRSGGFKFDNNLPHETLNTIVINLQEKIHKFSTKAHKIMQS